MPINNKTLITFCPHGINPKTFRPITEADSEWKDYIEFKTKLLNNKSYEFVLLFNSRNIHRKHPSDLIYAYKIFCDHLTKEQSEKCLLMLKTDIRDEHGTDLLAVKEAICPNYNIHFIEGRFDSKNMNFIYNIADVTANISSNEGFGLSTAESVMAGTPILVNATGGMIDYCGFTDNDGKPIQYTKEWGSNHDGKFKNHGVWTIPVFPSSRSLQGSCVTPYILDDRNKLEDIAEAILTWYNVSNEDREKAGAIGRQWFIDGYFNSNYMCESLIEGFEAVFKHWTPREKFEIYKIEKRSKESGGVQFEPLNEERVSSKVNILKNKLN